MSSDKYAQRTEVRAWCWNTRISARCLAPTAFYVYRHYRKQTVLRMGGRFGEGKHNVGCLEAFHSTSYSMVNYFCLFLCSFKTIRYARSQGLPSGRATCPMVGLSGETDFSALLPALHHQIPNFPRFSGLSHVSSLRCWFKAKSERGINAGR